MPPFVATLFGFIRGIPGAALNFIDRRRWWAKEDRAEIDETYQREIANLKEQLDEADEAQEKASFKQEIKRVREEQRQFYRARRELLLSKSLVQRMTPTGPVTAGEPALPQADRELLQAAASIVVRLQPPRTAKDHIFQGNAFYTAGDFQRALEQYNRTLKLRPDDPDTLNNRGATLRHLQRYDEALVDYNRSLDLRPDDPSTLYNRGYSLDDLQRYDEALADYNRSLELRPDDPNTLNNRGATLIKIKRYEDALTDFNRALEPRPDDPKILNNRGIARYHLRQDDEALADFQRAIELDPNYVTPIYNRACAYSFMGRLEESLEQLKAAISRDATNRKAAREDEDFANLRSDPTLGPEFKRLVAEPEP